MFHSLSQALVVATRRRGIDRRSNSGNRLRAALAGLVFLVAACADAAKESTVVAGPGDTIAPPSTLVPTPVTVISVPHTTPSPPPNKEACEAEVASRSSLAERAAKSQDALSKMSATELTSVNVSFHPYLSLRELRSLRGDIVERATMEIPYINGQQIHFTFPLTPTVIPEPTLEGRLNKMIEVAVSNLEASIGASVTDPAEVTLIRARIAELKAPGSNPAISAVMLRGPVQDVRSALRGKNAFDMTVARPGEELAHATPPLDPASRAALARLCKGIRSVDGVN